MVGGYFVFNGNKNGESAEVSDNNGEVQSEPTGKKMAFSEFLKQGGAYKCEVSQSVSDMENSGTVYVNGANVRGEFSTIAEGKPMNTSFLMKDGFSYTWSSALPTMGFKVKVDQNTTGNTNTDLSGTYNWNANQIGDYNCEPWTVDQAKFTLPGNITFTELGDK